MKSNILLLTFALFLLIMAMTKQTFALDNSNISGRYQDLDSATDMIILMNNYRQEAGLSPYVLNDSLNNAAQRVADHMAATEFTSHYDADGASPSKRALQAGYDDHVTEIIYGGFGGGAAAWEWWMTNETYTGLILSQDYHEFGVGMAVGAESERFYWAIMFGAGVPTAVTNDRPSPAAAGIVTKLPASEETAVPSPTIALIVGPAPTEVFINATLSPLTDQPDNLLPTLINADSAEAVDTIMPHSTATPAPTGSDGESPWLVIAAAITILAGIIIFYFPRLAWTRP
jgi:uncharacterized protein YkwD